MNLPPLDLDSLHEGYWLTWDSLWELVPIQARTYYSRFRHLFVGDVADLEQAGYLALLELRKASGESDRIREIPALTAIHKGMVQEIKSNRRQASEDVDGCPEPKQLNEKQVEMLAFWRRKAAYIVGKECWELLWLRKCLCWTPEQVASFLSKKNKKYMDADDVERLLDVGIKRLKKIDPAINIDIRLLHFYR